MNAPSIKQENLPPSQPQKKLYAYDANNNMIYEGWADPGVLSSEPKWAIRKATFDGNNNMIMERFAFASGSLLQGSKNTQKIFVWDNRTTYDYQ